MSYIIIMEKTMKILGVVFCLTLAGCGGSAGATGATGASGTNGETIVSELACNKLDAGSGTSLFYVYENVLYSTGDRFVTCTIQTNAVGISNSIIYRSYQVGATTGTCLVAADIDAVSGGFWEFTSQSGVTKTTYIDSTSAENNYLYTFAPSDCATF